MVKRKKIKIDWPAVRRRVRIWAYDVGRFLPRPLEGKYQYAARLKQLKYEDPEWAIDFAIDRMTKSGELTASKNNKFLELSQKGRIKYLLENIEKIEASQTELYLIVFDIPESQRRKRNMLRKILASKEYEQIQKSVYLGQGKFSREFLMLLEELRVSEGVLIFRVNQIA